MTFEKWKEQNYLSITFVWEKDCDLCACVCILGDHMEKLEKIEQIKSISMLVFCF